ncbi:MAG: hypothetical protein GVY32_11870 [Gammaproteobacteria bacterium]|jgi:hypothetical protein|nr:hypothetical protein [Gammaproteobacteria bacterium]
MNEINWRPIALQILILLAVAFGVLAWTQRPEGALVWLVGMLSIPLGWLLVVASGAMPGSHRPVERKTIYNSLIVSAVMITGALAACALGTLGTIDEEWITRYGMIVVALALVITGNGLPKKPDTRCDRPRGLATRRLLGWVFVVSGLSLTLAWLTLPLAHDVVWWATAAIYATAGVVCAVGIWRITRSASANAAP